MWRVSGIFPGVVLGPRWNPLAQQVAGGLFPLVINLQCHPRHAYGHLRSALTCSVTK